MKLLIALGALAISTACATAAPQRVAQAEDTAGVAKEACGPPPVSMLKSFASPRLAIYRNCQSIERSGAGIEPEIRR